MIVYQIFHPKAFIHISPLHSVRYIPLIRRHLWSSALLTSNSSPPEQNGRHFGRRHFQMHFLEKKMMEFRFKFHWNWFPGVQLTIRQHWFRWCLGTDQATSHYLNQCWPDSLMHICGTRGRSFISWRFGCNKSVECNLERMRIIPYLGWCVHQILPQILKNIIISAAASCWLFDPKRFENYQRLTKIQTFPDQGNRQLVDLQ